MFYRKVIRITAEDSPNVKLAEREIREGKKPSNRILIPGVKSYADYMRDREFWDEELQCVGLDAKWYMGAEILLYPPDWINNAERVATELSKKVNRKPTHLGIDPAEGGDNTSMAAIDKLGLIALESRKTPDTNDIYITVLEFINRWNILPKNVYFDVGGGGKQHVDRLRANGYHVNTVGFGESLKQEKRRGMTTIANRKELDEERYVYKNRRAQMYGLLSQAIDPGSLSTDENGKLIDDKSANMVFGLPKEFLDKSYDHRKPLRRQMEKIPKLRDGEGRLYLLAKSKTNKDSKEKTLIELIGHSPDELESVVLAIYGLLGKKKRPSNVGTIRMG